MTPRLVVFDLDGTLVDSRDDLATAANRMLASYGLDPLDPATVAGMVGEGARLLVDRVLAARGLPADRWPSDALTRYLAHYDDCLLDETRPYDGAVDMVQALAEHHVLAVVTNKPSAPAVRLLQHFGFAPYLSAIVGGDGPFPRKPDPSSILDLMRRFDATGRACALVGDSWVDLQTARAAGAQAVCAAYGFGFQAMAAADLAGVRLVSRPLALLEIFAGDANAAEA